MEVLRQERPTPAAAIGAAAHLVRSAGWRAVPAWAPTAAAVRSWICGSPSSAVHPMADRARATAVVRAMAACQITADRMVRRAMAGRAQLQVMAALRTAATAAAGVTPAHPAVAAIWAAEAADMRAEAGTQAVAIASAARFFVGYISTS